MINELFLPFSMTSFQWSGYTIANLIVAAVSSLLLISLAVRTPYVLGRPAFMVGIFANVIFQWAIALFSAILARQIDQFWLLSVAIHTAVLFCVLLLWRTPGLTAQLAHGVSFISAGNSLGQQQALSLPATFTILFIFLVLSAFYIWMIEPQCTAFYAMLFDPELALLARETGGKIFGAGAASYLFGGLVNVVCPLAIYACVVSIRSAIGRRQFWAIPIWAAFAALALTVILMTGTKGNLLPTAICLIVGILASGIGTLPGRVLTTVIVAAGTLAFLSGMETIIHRQGSTAGCYPVGACAVRHNACSPTKQLVASLWQREMSLGLPRSRLVFIENDLSGTCDTQLVSRPVLQCVANADPNRVRENERLAAIINRVPVGAPNSGTESADLPKQEEPAHSVSRHGDNGPKLHPPSSATYSDPNSAENGSSAAQVPKTQAPPSASQSSASQAQNRPQATPPTQHQSSGAPAASAPAAQTSSGTNTSSAPPASMSQVSPASKPAQELAGPPAFDAARIEAERLEREQRYADRIKEATGEEPPAASAVVSRTARILDFTYSIIYRAAIIPTQVGSWHYRWVQEFGSPGLKAFPIVWKFAGNERVIMSIAVNQAYYPIYSNGDSTATGTTPTSFIIGYPAYLGIAGILIVLAAITAFDLVTTNMLIRLEPALRGIGQGLLTITSYNFMASDFTVTLASHGGLATIAMLGLLYFISRLTGTNSAAAART